jgi:hypothetical protein
VSGMRRAPDHDHHALAGAGIADAGRHSEQLIRYEPLALLELPDRRARHRPALPLQVLSHCLLQVRVVHGDASSVLVGFPTARGAALAAGLSS